MRLFLAELEKFVTRRTTWITTLLFSVWLFGSLTFALYVLRSIASTVEAESLAVANLPYFAIWAYFVAAAAIGAEASSGTLGTLLTFEPLRGGVLAAKLLAVLLPTMALSGVVMFMVVVIGRALSLGALDGLVRSVLVVGLAAVLGFTVALIGRSILSALGGLLLWGVAILLQFVLYAIRSSDGSRATWIGLETLLLGFIGDDYFGASSIPSRPVAALCLALITVAAIAACWLDLRRRDVR
ncbi:hypothetical protein [Mariniluteicoccus flavus]